jgi:hypothetical protein
MHNVFLQNWIRLPFILKASSLCSFIASCNYHQVTVLLVLSNNGTNITGKTIIFLLGVIGKKAGLCQGHVG